MNFTAADREACLLTNMRMNMWGYGQCRIDGVEASRKYFAVPLPQLQYHHCITRGIANQDTPLL